MTAAVGNREFERDGIVSDMLIVGVQATACRLSNRVSLEFAA
jgi:hypothetical protein